jgi:hypothetical protein
LDNLFQSYDQPVRDRYAALFPGASLGCDQPLTAEQGERLIQDELRQRAEDGEPDWLCRACWSARTGRYLAADLSVLLSSIRLLIRDRDGKYSPAFDAVFQAEEIHILRPQIRRWPRAMRAATCSSR